MSLTVFEQPKLALLPEVQRGGPKIPRSQILGRGAWPRVTVAKVTFKTEPVS